MTEPNRGSGSSQDIIDDALRMVDALQRRLVTAGVRRGVSGGNASEQGKGDVWQEAVREEPTRPRPPLEELADIARSTAPEVAGHLGRAGMTLFGALGEAWQVIDRSRRAEQDRPSGRGPESEPPSIDRGD